jgi:hypothetical protein
MAGQARDLEHVYSKLRRVKKTFANCNRHIEIEEKTISKLFTSVDAVLQSEVTRAPVPEEDGAYAGDAPRPQWRRRHDVRPRTPATLRLRKQVSRPPASLSAPGSAPAGHLVIRTG